MAALRTAASEDLKSTMLAILDENRIMSLATNRADGWPQVTLVGYVHDDLTLYCTVGLSSQKLANVTRDPRVSVAIGHDDPKQRRGLSLSGRALRVTDIAEVARLNAVIADHYPEQRIFSPREPSCAVLRITPKLVSIIDPDREPGLPRLVEVSSETFVQPLDEGGDNLAPEAPAPAVEGRPPRPFRPPMV